LLYFIVHRSDFIILFIIHRSDFIILFPSSSFILAPLSITMQKVV